jgi:hypothetical protein
MYRRFDFEGDIHASLECVPLTVRRKLDLAAIKISLEGWQRLPREERLCLCHLPVDTAEEIAVYREVLLGFCERRAVASRALPDPAVEGRPWNAASVPALLGERASALGASLDDATWSRLDEESRYALLKLADPGRGPEKLEAALVELGLRAGPAPEIHPGVTVCEAPAAGRS